MVRSRMTLWMRGLAAFSMAALAVSLAGCALGSAADDADVDEAIGQAESQFDKGNGQPGAPTMAEKPAAPVEDPEPDPWHPHREQQSDPTNPDDLAGGTLSPSNGHRDE